MRIQALENFTPRWWAPADQDPEHLVEFKIRPLDGEQYAEVAQYVRYDNGQMRFTADAARLALRHGLVDWRNFLTPAGSTPVCNAGNHRLIPFDVRAAIFAEILDISNLDEDQEKNSLSPLTSLKTGSDSIA